MNRQNSSLKEFIKNEKEKINNLDALYQKCTDMRKNVSDSKNIKIPLPLFKQFSNIVHDLKKYAIKNIDNIQEIESLKKENEELKERLEELDMEDVIDEENPMDDDDDDNDDLDLEIETFSSIEKSKGNIDQYFSNSDLKPFNSGDNNIYSNAGLNEVFNTTIENWSSNNNYFKSNDYSLLEGNNPNTPLANEYGSNSNYLNIK